MRLFQIFRYAKASGVVLLFIALIIIAGIIFKMINGFLNLDSHLQIMVPAGVILLLHYARSDIPFLKNIFEHDFYLRTLLAIEYTLISFPFMAAIGIQDSFGFLYMIIPAALSFLLPFPKIKIQNRFNLKLDIIPLSLFELKSYQRKYPFILPVLVLLSFASFLHLSMFILFSLLLSSTVLSIFNINESEEWLMNPNFNLTHRIGIYSLAVFTLSAPAIIGALIQYPHQYLVIIYILISQLILIASSISIKYANYNPIRYSNQNKSTYSILLVFLITPGLILANIILMIIYFIKANKRIRRFYA